MGAYAASHDFSMKHCTVANNEARASAGGVGIQAVRGTGTEIIADISHSTIVDNKGSYFRRNYGGGVAFDARAGRSVRGSVTDSIISGNSVAAGGGIAAVGSGVVLDVMRSTVSGNTAVGTASGPDANAGIGGGILSVDATTNLTDLIVTGNSATGLPVYFQGVGGGILNLANADNEGTAIMNIVRTEVYDNDASAVDGVATIRCEFRRCATSGRAGGILAETTFRQTTICEDNDTCGTNEFHKFLMPTTEISLGRNVDSDDQCNFIHPSDEVSTSCGSANLRFESAKYRMESYRSRTQVDGAVSDEGDESFTTLEAIPQPW